jgi:hypothetical protein
MAIGDVPRCGARRGRVALVAVVVRGCTPAARQVSMGDGVRGGGGGGGGQGDRRREQDAEQGAVHGSCIGGRPALDHDSTQRSNACPVLVQRASRTMRAGGDGATVRV